MRIRSIFNFFNFLNKIHFKFQNEFLIVNFVYWMQMLLMCEINEIAKKLRNFDLNDENFVILSNLILILKLCAKFFWKNSRTNLWKIKLQNFRIKIKFDKITKFSSFKSKFRNFFAISFISHINNMWNAMQRYNITT